ncbi:hypothetical protein EWB00_006253 [Schistosoma japonicum]|uniref:Uncharacterized protein n=1 Tax=Schistosoma japonicum TaxID=6182 RepID=A0A4Z2CZ84_SCHJA|nr:hypothetical protein EWB00_006253 [Schistosoma japonicum]
MPIEVLERLQEVVIRSNPETLYDSFNQEPIKVTPLSDRQVVEQSLADAQLGGTKPHHSNRDMGNVLENHQTETSGKPYSRWLETAVAGKDTSNSQFSYVTNITKGTQFPVDTGTEVNIVPLTGKI